MTLKDACASSSEDVVDARHAIGRSRSQLVTCAVKAGVKHFIRVTSENFDALTSAYVPQARRSVDRPCQAVVSREIELAASQLS